MASKRKYWEGWGFTDLIKVILTGKPKERNQAYNEVSKTFEEAQVEKIGTDQIEVYLPEHEIKNLKAMAKLFGLKVQYSTGGALTTESYKTGGRPSMSIAEVILQQIGGMNRVVAMTGAYNFVAGSNYLAFKIKNRRANYIKITLNGKDLYDIEIGRIFGSKYNVVKSYKDVYFDQLIPLLEEGTGMYFRFEKGGAVKKKEVTEAAMLAPNGKPSNLTPEQYRLVRTQAFKNWFGDWEKLAMTKLYDAGIDEISMKRLSEGVSKVVDENGEPLVVYHGTKKDFTVFGTENKLSEYLPEYRHLYSWKMNTHYFHKDKQYSETFGSKYGGKDLAFFLKADNLVLAESEDDMEDIGYWEGIYKYYVEELNADAIYDSKGQYATLLNSNQIKLADGSNTTFDSNNPDIRYEVGGYLEQTANDPALEYAKGGRLHKSRKKRIKDDKMVFDIPEQPDQVFDSEMFAKGGKLGVYSFVTAYTETGKKLYKIWKDKPTHQTVFNFFNKLNNSAGQKINIVDAEIEIKSFSTFNRETFLIAANKVAMEQYGSGIDDVDELIFTFDRENLNVFPFEAELENDKDVEISCIDGVIFITEIED